MSAPTENETDIGRRAVDAARQAVSAAEIWAAAPLDPAAQRRARDYLVTRAPDDLDAIDALFADGTEAARARLNTTLPGAES
jgi:hypothetical protein